MAASTANEGLALDFWIDLDTFLPMTAKCCLVCAILVGLTGCATTQQGTQARFQPKPPYLLNALADTADTIAEHAPGPLKYPPRVHATVFRALTPGFWLKQNERGRISRQWADDKRFLEDSGRSS